MAILPGYPFWKRVPGYESVPGYPGTTRFAEQSNFVLKIVNTGGNFSSWSQQSQVVSHLKLLFFHCLELKFQKTNISCHTCWNMNSRIMSMWHYCVMMTELIKFAIHSGHWDNGVGSPICHPLRHLLTEIHVIEIPMNALGNHLFSKCDFWSRSWNTPYSLGNIW